MFPRRLRLVALVALGCLGCIGSGGLRTSPSAEIAESPEVQIRLRVIGMLAGLDDPQRSDPGWLYVLDREHATAEVRRAVRFLGKQQGLDIVWVRSWEDAGVDRWSGRPASRGLLIGLGPILVADGEYSIAASVSTSILSESGQGATYRFQRVGDRLVFVGETDGWISAIELPMIRYRLASAN